MLAKKIGFLGCGNMGRGILSGVIQHKIARPRDIFVYDIIHEKLREIKREFKVQTVKDAGSLVKRVGIVLLAIKPQDLGSASHDIRKALTARHLVITILAGVPIARIKKELGSKIHVVRAMPNLGATVGEAVTAITSSKVGNLRVAEKIFSGCGSVLRLPERYFDLVTALSGSGPAYFFYLIELLVREGVRNGLSEKAAAFLIKQTAKGSALLAYQSQEPVSRLRQRVTSKRGTTEAALKTLEVRGFPGIFHQAITNAIRRAKQLGRK